MRVFRAIDEFLQLNRSGDISLELRSQLFGVVFWVVFALTVLGDLLTGSLMGSDSTRLEPRLITYGTLILVWLLWKLLSATAAAYFLVWGMWGLATLVVISEAGGTSYWLVPQFLLIVMTRYLLNGRAAILLGLVTAVADFAIYQFDLQNVLPPPLRYLGSGNNLVPIVISLLFLMFIFFLADTVLRESLRQSKLTEGRYRSLFEKTNDAVFLVGPDQYLLSVNQQAADLLGYSVDELKGKYYPDLIIPEERPRVQENFKRLEKEGISPFFERTVIRKDGSRCQVEFNATAIRDENGKLIYFQGVARDLTERKRLEEQLRYSLQEMETLAMQDPLSGLLNRRAITEHAEAEWHRSARERRPMCIVLIDLDNLKDVNDSLGHQVGDQAIIELAAVIKASRRRYDWAGRWGGDEFMLVLPGANLVEAFEVTERLRAQYAESPVTTQMAERIRPHMSAGVACYSGRPGENIPLNQLITQADQALYRAKQAGKNRVELYRDEK